MRQQKHHQQQQQHQLGADTGAGAADDSTAAAASAAAAPTVEDWSERDQRIVVRSTPGSGLLADLVLRAKVRAVPACCCLTASRMASHAADGPACMQHWQQHVFCNPHPFLTHTMGSSMHANNDPITSKGRGDARRGLLCADAPRLARDIPRHQGDARAPRP